METKQCTVRPFQMVVRGVLFIAMGLLLKLTKHFTCCEGNYMQWQVHFMEFIGSVYVIKDSPGQSRLQNNDDYDQESILSNITSCAKPCSNTEPLF